MKARAFIFDVYGTLLEVGPPSSDAEARWLSLWNETFGSLPPMSRLDISAKCSKIIAEKHNRARQAGIAWPEVYWPSILRQAIPNLSKLPVAVTDNFIFRHIRLGHTVSMMQETAAVLRWLACQEVSLGIASNAQGYTYRELSEALAVHGLSMDIFQADLCFWSYQHGFSKPDPHVFQWVSSRLEAQGISCETTVMVGDRLDNDIEPARRHGWQVWHRTIDHSNWNLFRDHFAERLESTRNVIL